MDGQKIVVTFQIYANTFKLVDPAINSPGSQSLPNTPGESGILNETSRLTFSEVLCTCFDPNIKVAV